MDGVVDDAVCEEMNRHIRDCEPCQAFIASLKQAVAQCRSCTPQCNAHRAEELRRVLLTKYQDAVAELERKNATTADHAV